MNFVQGAKKRKKILQSQVRFPFLSLNLSKTMDLFWSGEFCSGGKKRKKILQSQVRFPFLSLNLSKTMDLFWSGKFCSGNPKKTTKKRKRKKKEIPAKPGAVPFLVSALVENYGFVLVRQILFR